MTEPRSTETFPLSRISTFDVGVIGGRKHQIAGLIEVDVTTARERLRRLRRSGDAISFFTFFVKSVAHAIQEFPQVHGVLSGRRRRVVFEDIDVSVVVERKVGETAVPVPVVIRACNKRSLAEIEEEMRDAAGQPGPERERPALLLRLYYLLPQVFRVAIMRTILARPSVRKRTMGTVIITSVAAGLRFPGWILHRTMHNLAFGLGSVVRKPGIVGNAIEPRDILHLSVLLDHDVVDGAPAARFVSKLVRSLESAAVLTAAPGSGSYHASSDVGATTE